MKGNNSLSNQELAKYSEEHLLYEINMLFWTASILSYLAPIANKGEIANALSNSLLNSFSVHARNLIGFLYSRQNSSDYPTDVVLEDYVQDPDYLNSLPPITDLLVQAKTKTDKQVSHLTLERIAYEKQDKEWKFVAIYQDIMKAFFAISHLFQVEKTSAAFAAAIKRQSVAVPRIEMEQILENDHAVGLTLQTFLKREQTKP